jgi:outer membrane protein
MTSSRSAAPAADRSAVARAIIDATGDDSGFQSGTATSVGLQAGSRSTRAACPRPHPPGAGARGPDPGAARRHRALGGAATRSAFADLPGRDERDQSNEVAVKANELALEGAAPKTASAPAPSSTCSMPSRNCSIAGAAGDRAARRLCRRLPAPERHGPGRGDDLGLDGGPLYDPLGNYRRVAGDWNDWSTTPPQPVATPARHPAEQPQGVTPARR